MADEELKRVRTLFVEKVSKAVIKQLLDDLQEDGVLNEGEKDSILDENPTKGDKARDLIDTVKRKGQSSSAKMIAHLKERDPELCATLGLQDGPSAPNLQSPAAAPTGKEKQDSRDIYPVSEDSMRNRVALLITNIRFKDERLNRRGAEKDEKDMEALLKSLKYEVVKHTNLTGKEIGMSLFKFSQHPKLKQTDSVVVVLMSHGKLGAILGVDRTDDNPDEFQIDKIYKYLGSEKCPALLHKPKIIIIQACRGDKGGAAFVSDSDSAAAYCDEDYSIEDDTVRCVHKEKDFISLLSCTPDTVSYRQPEHGSFLIQFLVEVIKGSELHKDHIAELFRKVLQRCEDFKNGGRRQMASIDRSTLPKNFFFFPPI